MRRVIVVLAAFAMVASAFAYPSNPPLGYAGNPPNNANCIACHGGNPLNAPGGSVTISGLPPAGYTPGTTYHLTVTQARTGLTRWGFELTSIYQSGSSWLQAGNLVVTDPTNTNLGVGTGTAPDYMRQTSSGTYPGQANQASWNFDWTAPNPAIGPISFYACGLACNNNGGTSGDWSYTTSSVVNPASAGPDVNVTMTPLNPPITIPANGGSFQFNASVQRTVGPAAPFYAWARDRNPDGTYTGNLLGPVQINPPVGVTVTRTRTQVVAATWPAGVHYYIGYANNAVSYPATDADSFAWTKSATADGGLSVWEAVNYGEEFPYQVGGASAPQSFALMGATPNPFNPSTAISYELRAASYTCLKVYDNSGRLVATLVEGRREAGTHQVTFDGSNLASGVYLYTLQAGSHTATGKMVLMK